jgi:hypothetical protein
VPAHPPALPHLPLTELFPGVWFASGTISMSRPPGVSFSRNMVGVRAGDGLVILNPVRLSAGAEAELLQKGRITDVVRLGTYHGRDDAYYVDTFGAAFWGVPGEQQYPQPKFTREIAEDGPFPIPDARVVVFKSATRPECVVYLPAHHLLVTCDSVQHYEKDRQLSLMARIVMWPMGFFKPCVIGPIWLKAVTPPGGSLRRDFERVLALGFDNLISAHGTPKMGGAQEALRRQVARLG